MTKTQNPSYRKSKSGQWVVFGPASIVRPGEVGVAKRDGSTKIEHIESVGKTFAVDGVECCYGYVAERVEAAAPHSGSCAQCGHGHGTYERRDSSGIAGRVCRTCSRDASYELSFA